MRISAALVVLLSASLAGAQISGDEKPIQAAYEALRPCPQIQLYLDGREVFGPRTNVLATDITYAWDAGIGPPLAKAEVNDLVNGLRTHRIAADGTTLWAYDFAKNTYSTFRYGSYSGSLPKQFRTSMFDELTATSIGQTTYPIRLLREVFRGDVADYRTWFPGATISVVQDQTSGHPEYKLENWQAGLGSLKDPVLASRTYNGSPTEAYIVYTYPTRLARSGAFRFTRADTGKPWNLTDIYYADIQRFSPSASRVVDWHIGIYTDPLAFLITPSFVFVAPANSHAIANPRSTGGG